MELVLSTIAGVESIAKKEIEMQWWIIEEVTDRLVTFSWWVELIPRINIWSRVGNKLYILLAEKENVKDFDSLFNLISSISWRKYFKKNFPIVVNASSTRSDLYSIKTIQWLWKKAIINALFQSSSLNLSPQGKGKLDEYYFEDENLEKVDILVLLINNKARILLNTSWDALHMRWYRKEAWKAPLKESLAAALVLLSGWKFKESFFDPFCGSGTIVIEALMIAKNIAPWLNRKFAFEKLGIVSSEITENERLLAKKKEYSGKYSIFASDNDAEVIEIAKENAKRAGLEGKIEFQTSPLIRGRQEGVLVWTLVSNPPYWERLKSDDLRWLYIDIDKLFMQNPNLNWWIISSFMEFDNIIKPWMYKKRKLYNWGEMCYFWKRI
jgi:putative N6-adenine-specific DNA methylase